MSTSDLVVMTPAKAKPETEQDVQRALREVAKAARTQPGCVDYRVFRSAAEPSTTVTFERWSSKEQREAFLAGPDVKAFIAAITGAFLETPQPVSYLDID